MKLQPINYTRLSNQNLTAEQENNKRKNNPSFGSLAGLATFIETQGFMGEFLTNDLFGMMGPRVWQGYNRNKEELGHLNHKAGREEAVRELLSGPAYFYVPMAVMGTAAFLMGKAAKVGATALDSFKPIMKKTVSGLSGLKDKALKENFVNKLTEEAFGGYKNETGQIDKIKQTLIDFANKTISKKQAEKQANEAITLLNKANGKYLDHTDRLQIKGKEFSINNTLQDVKNYLTDFTNKAETATEHNREFINKFHQKAKNFRNAANILSMAALSAFLVIIPRLYKTGDNFPGKDGLVKNKKTKKSAEIAAASKKSEEVANAGK